MPWLLTLGTLRAISLRYPRLATTSAERQKLRQQTFETTIIERYRRREGSVEEALIEMYLAGVSMRRVESPSTGVGSQQEDLDREAIDAYSRDRFFSGGDNRKSREVSLMRLNAMSAASVAILLSLVFLDSASAEGGCGPGFHRTPYGRCRPNEGPVVVAPAAPVVVAPAAPVVVAPAAPVVCRGGFRWHPRLRRCVVP